jgi:CHAT domain-containing protein
MLQHRNLILLSCSLILLSSLQANAQPQSIAQSVEYETQQQNISLSPIRGSDQKIKEAMSLFSIGDQSYRAGNFKEAERALRQIISGTFKEEFDQPPNLKIPKPGGLKETKFNIPFIFNYHSSYTVPSQIAWMEPQRKVAFDDLFAAVTTRIARSSSSLKTSDLHLPILNRLGGCIYSGSSGGSVCNQWIRTDKSSLDQIFGNDIFSASFGKDNLPEMDVISKKVSKEFNYTSNIHSISKNTLNLLQKSLIAQGGQKNIEEALIFAEQSRNMELTRIAPTAIYGMLNYKEIAGNPAYSKFLRAIPFNGIDLKTIRKIAAREQATIVYYSTVASNDDKKLFAWVIQPSGDILFKEIALSSLNSSSLGSVVNSTVVAASSFVNRGRQTTSRIQAVRSLRSQSYERQRNSVEDFFIEESTQAQRLQYLHSLLIKPIEDLLPNNSESDVIFIPQGELTVVPFAALRDADGRYLIEKHTIRTAYSFANLKRPIKRIRKMPKGKEVLMVGNPDAPDLTYNNGSVHALPKLPYAQVEAVEISNSLSGNWFIKDAASLKRIAPFLADAKIIHFAAHGLSNYSSHREFMLIQRLEGDENNSLHIEQPVTGGGLVDSSLLYKVWYEQKSPETRWQVIQTRLSLPGAIALAESLLTAEQILSMRLKADLVVLSACNTAQGVNTESGVLGLPFAFGLAGVPKATVALWSVPDESTKLLMSEFYSAMNRNSSSNKDANPAKSLREAMLKVQKQSSFSDPIHWAGFTVMDVSY